MATFIQRGNTWHVRADADLHPYPVLPTGNYVVKRDEHQQYYLDMVDNFTVPARLYGNVTRHTQRIINTFHDRSQSTGVLLAGDKGSGKTLLSKNISVELAKLGIPTIIVNTNFCGEEFNTFIQLIHQPCAVVFDEFEKVYDRDHQAQLLTLLDGVFPTKKLFVLTCNEPERINFHMQNRPGRIYYCLKFVGLEEAFVREYCVEKLQNQTHTDKVCNISQLFNSFNFDMLQALVEEMNRYGEDPQTALKMLNIFAESEGSGEYSVKLIHDGQEYSGESLYRSTIYENPFSDIEVSVNLSGENYSKNDGNHQDFEFSMKDFLRYDPAGKVFYYKNPQGDELFLTKIPPRTHNIYAF